jgi:hypothetical protein
MLIFVQGYPINLYRGQKYSSKGSQMLHNFKYQLHHSHINQTNSYIDFKIKNEDGKIIKPTIPAHSIIDFIYNQKSV